MYSPINSYGTFSLNVDDERELVEVSSNDGPNGHLFANLFGNNTNSDQIKGQDPNATPTCKIVSNEIETGLDSLVYSALDDIFRIIPSPSQFSTQNNVAQKHTIDKEDPHSSNSPPAWSWSMRSGLWDTIQDQSTLSDSKVQEGPPEFTVPILPIPQIFVPPAPTIPTLPTLPQICVPPAFTMPALPHREPTLPQIFVPPVPTIPNLTQNIVPQQYDISGTEPHRQRPEWDKKKANASIVINIYNPTFNFGTTSNQIIPERISRPVRDPAIIGPFSV